MGILLKGKPVADEIKEKLKAEVDELRKKGIIPKLAIIRVGTTQVIWRMSAVPSRQW